ncbi:MAG TPA: hypothetical protein VFV58_28805 [Blastocatellia bacterium]|jgi:hypothetical protein|nr:hypothetical protein [Blastocatellia bacterium]
MKNRNIQFKPTTGVLIPLLLACLAVVFIAVPSPVAANNHDDDRPFTGTVSGTIPEDLGPPLPGTDGCVFSFTVPNSGDSNHLGQFIGTANFVPNLCDGSYTGTFQWTAQNGDRISGPFRGQLIPTATPGVYLNMETSLVTGGTGRFRHATGMFTLYGVVDFNTRTFVLPWQGTISLDRH